MKKYIYFLLLAASITGTPSCQKDPLIPAEAKAPVITASNLTVAEAKSFIESQSAPVNISSTGGNKTFKLSGLPVNWKTASTVALRERNWVLLHLPGQPTFDDVKQGYRKLLVFRDTSKAITARILEVIPDALYIQRKGRSSIKDFTGRVFIYNSEYQLEKGLVYYSGRVTGEIKPVPKTTGTPTIKRVQVIEDCQYVTGAYIDGEGVITLYAEKQCSYSIYDDGFGYYDDWGGSDGGYSLPPASDPVGGGGGGGGESSSAPAVSNLPGEDQPAVDGKSLMDCFGTVPNAGAKLTLTIYVQEPFPGTTFNYGPNSVGHTAIGLTKSGGGQTITQVVGFYPKDGSKDAFGGGSKLVENSGMSFNRSISYTLTEDQFHNVASYISGPLPNYDLTAFNCTSFAYAASSKAGIILPDPFNTIGSSYSPGVPPPVAMCPAGLGNSIGKLADGPGVNKNGGSMPTSHGPCK